MEGRLDGDTVRVGAPARERYYDSHGYGHPQGDALSLAPVEAAHLLYRGNLDAVDGMDFQAFLIRTGTTLPFVVYKDLRERGFYLTPAREGWVGNPHGADLVVYPRGQGPWDDEVEYRVRVLSERQSVDVGDLGTIVLAVVDEDGELTYFETSRGEVVGGRGPDIPHLTGDLLEDRVLVMDPPSAVHEEAFFGQPLHGRDATAGPLHLSLVEAAYLRHRSSLTVSGDGGDGRPKKTDDPAGSSSGSETDETTISERGRAVEGDRFDRRLRTYAALRDAGLVPKSGFKFGADFRVYDEFESLDDMGHSDRLVRVVDSTTVYLPREISLDVRLAAGVRKQMTFAVVGDELDWVTIERLTP